MRRKRSPRMANRESAPQHRCRGDWRHHQIENGAARRQRPVPSSGGVSSPCSEAGQRSPRLASRAAPLLWPHELPDPGISHQFSSSSPDPGKSHRCGGSSPPRTQIHDPDLRVFVSKMNRPNESAGHRGKGSSSSRTRTLRACAMLPALQLTWPRRADRRLRSASTGEIV